MKIFIIGAGFTGMQLARALVLERNNVILIDTDPERAGRARRLHGLHGRAQHGRQHRAGVRAAGSRVELWGARRAAQVVLHVRHARRTS